MSKKASNKIVALGRARRVKNDEFYTQRKTVQDELNSILEHFPKYFSGMSVLLPCDSEKSEFYKLFSERFEELGLAKLVATSFARGGESRGLKIERVKGEREATFTRLEGDGDFRSEEVTSLLEESDFVITNPPFSLMKDFFPWVAESGKEFSILVPITTPPKSSFFHYFKEERVFISPSTLNTQIEFKIPSTAEKNSHQRVLSDGSRVSAVGVFFVSSFFRPPTELPMRTAEWNITNFPYKKLREEGYRMYDNFPILEVPYARALPSDFEGIMAAPLTLIKFLPHPRVEILGLSQPHGWPVEELGQFEHPKIDGVTKFIRIFVRWKKDDNIIAS